MTTCAIPVSCWASVSAAWVSRNGCHGVFLATWPIVCDRMNVQKFTNGIFVSFLNWKCYFLQCSCHKLKVDKYTLVVPKCCSWESSPSQYFAGSVALNRYLLWIISSCQVHIALAIPGWHMQWVMSLFCHIYFVRLLATVAQWHIQRLSMTSQVLATVTTFQWRWNAKNACILRFQNVKDPGGRNWSRTLQCAVPHSPQHCFNITLVDRWISHSPTWSVSQTSVCLPLNRKSISNAASFLCGNFPE